MIMVGIRSILTIIVNGSKPERYLNKVNIKRNNILEPKNQANKPYTVFLYKTKGYHKEK